MARIRLGGITRKDVLDTFSTSSTKRGKITIKSIPKADWMDERVYQVSTGKYKEAIRKLDAGEFKTTGGFHKYLYSQSDEYRERGIYQGKENLKRMIEARYSYLGSDETLAKIEQAWFLIDNLSGRALDKFWADNEMFLIEAFDYEKFVGHEAKWSNEDMSNIDYILDELLSHSNKKNISKSKTVYKKSLESFQ